MSGRLPKALRSKALSDMRFAVPTGLPMKDLHPTVEAAFNRTVSALEQAGAHLVSIDVPEFELAGEILGTAPFAAYDAWQYHQERLTQQREEYDPFVAWRMSTGQNISAQTQQNNIERRQTAVLQYKKRMEPYDALLMPTTADLPRSLRPCNTTWT